MQLLLPNFLPLSKTVKNVQRGRLIFLKDFFTKKLPLLAIMMLLASSALIAQNLIVAENAKPGSPASEWDIVGKGDLSIQGFATEISVNKGQKVKFKIKTDADSYTVEIYRIGYYNGNGARKVGNAVVTAALPQIQPEDLYDAVTGKTDCSNWDESAEWSMPSDAVSGFYIAKLTRADNGGSSHILFVVRDDAGNSNLLFKTSDATWQAYNNYGGNSLYENFSGIPILGFSHATKVSYNRPFYIRTGYGDESDCFTPFSAEYPMIRWLERNGYDVSYTTDAEMSKDEVPITPAKHKVLLSVGHDEYWSGPLRNKFENARNAGVHLAFFSGNEVYWKVRWEDNGRTLVCYKEGEEGAYACGGKCDPKLNEWTGLWRTGCLFPGTGGCKPENDLTGQISFIQITGAITVPSAYKNLRFWRNTSIANLADGETATLSAGTLGYEWDYEQFPESLPATRIALSQTVLGNRTHKLSLYRNPSGAWVFGAGTVQWSWGLDGVHDRGGSEEDPRMQQATVNLFADMGAQPGTLQNNLVSAVAATDNQPPVTSITSPVNGATLSKDGLTTISGTASDIGGSVGGIEISLDGGVTWNLANGAENWTYTWKPSVLGAVSIKVRAFDDNGNVSKEANYSLLSVTVGPQKCPCNVFEPTDIPFYPLLNDGMPIEVGFKFRADKDGVISKIRYYKGAGATGVRLGHLWSSDGTLLSEVTFTNETASGWQEIAFAQPVAITANTTYVASVFSSSGDFALTNPYFTQSIVNGPLTALGNGVDGPNGVYKYSATSVFPNENYLSSNYWVDVVYNLGTFQIVTQPISQEICLGSPVTFTVAASGSTAPAIQWQVSTNGILWSNIPGANSGTLTFVPTILDNEKLYRAVVTRDGVSINSAVASLTVNQVIASVFQKSNAGCTNGSMSIAQTGGTSPYTYRLNGGPPQTSSTFSNLAAGTYTVTVTDAKGCTSTITGITISQTSNLNGYVWSKTDATCGANNGSFIVFALFGKYPYQYSLDGTNYQSSGTFSNLSGGTYNVKVKDASGCTTTISGITIAQSSTLNASLTSKTNVSCSGNDGSLTVAATGGTSAYSYSINGTNYQSSSTFNNLSAGTYNVKVKDAKGCIVTVSGIAISQVALTAITSDTDISCLSNDGSITVTATGGIGAYTYSLNGGNYQSGNTFNNLVAGTYSVKAKDAKGCTATVSGIVISKLPALAVSLTSKSDISCIGTDGSITVTASGGAGAYTYSLNGVNYQGSGTFSNLSAGTYSIKVKDSKNCSVTSSAIVIAKLSSPTVSLSSKTNVSCIGNDGSITVTASGGTGPYTYSLNGVNYQSSTTFNNLSGGTYSVKVKDAKTCVSTVSGITISQATTVTASLTSKTNENCSANDGTLTVTGSGGTGPYTYSINGGSYQSNNTFTSLDAGTYTVNVKDMKGCIAAVSGIAISSVNTLTASLTSKTNESCKGDDGSITVTGSGGTGAYTYSLNGGSYQSDKTFGDLSSGTYSVKVKDAKGCISTVSGIVISAVNTLTSVLSGKTNANCNEDDGTLTVVASGGTAPYYYILSTGTYQSTGKFTNLEPGSYNAWVVDSKGCYTVIYGITISEVSTLAVGVSSKSNETCVGNNGSITVAGTGGRSPYTYSLNGVNYQTGSTFSNLSDGTYTITVKDYKGCKASVSGVAIASVPFTASVSSKGMVSCVGKDGSITISATGGTSPYQFSVNSGSYFSDADNTIGSLSAGTYTIKVKDAKGCVSTISGIVVSQAATLTVAVTSKTNGCSNLNNATITVAGAGGVTPYQYSINGGTYKTSGAFTGLSAGTYSLKVKDARGCTATVSGVTVTRSSAACSSSRSSAPANDGNSTGGAGKLSKNIAEVPGISVTAGVHITPNPSNGNFNLSLKGLNGLKVGIRILDAVGREVVNKQVTVSSDNIVIPFNLKNVAKGMYFVTVVSEKKNFSEKVIVQ